MGISNVYWPRIYIRSMTQPLTIPPFPPRCLCAQYTQRVRHASMTLRTRVTINERTREHRHVTLCYSAFTEGFQSLTNTRQVQRWSSLNCSSCSRMAIGRGVQETVRTTCINKNNSGSFRKINGCKTVFKVFFFCITKQRLTALDNAFPIFYENRNYNLL